MPPVVSLIFYLSVGQVAFVGLIIAIVAFAMPKLLGVNSAEKRSNIVHSSQRTAQLRFGKL